MTGRHESALIAEQALVAVVGPTVVAGLREDSPLAAAGIGIDDLVCIADAAAQAASRRGLACALDDAALESVVTVADLVGAVEQACRPA